MFSDDTTAAGLTCEQAEACAVLVAACARGLDRYCGALPDVARLLMLAAVSARAGLDDEPDVAAAWDVVAAWPPPDPGVSR